MDRRLIAPPLVLALLATAACQGGDRASQSDDGDVAARVGRTAPVTMDRRSALVTAVARVAPAVVTVQTQSVERVPADMFEQFFGGRSGSRQQAGLGTGFIVRKDGVIVTNAHVVAGATQVSVMMRDGTTYPATVRGADETNDIAVLQVKAPDLPVAPLGDSDDLLVAEWAVAIGNPYGFVLGNAEPSVTAGVISGVGRNLVAQGEGPSAYFDMIQTDASINPGNSGGPLINADGEVIGVNSSIFSTSGGSIGLGFAIPINRVKRVVEDLLEHGAVRRAWVGIKVRLGQVPSARALITREVVVAAVTPGSPADRAGIRPGDVIVSARGKPLHNVFEWEGRLLDVRVGDAIPLRVRRGDRTFDARLVVEDLPEVNAPKVEVLRELQLVTLTPAIRAERGVAAPNGALVYDISPRMSETLGMAAGDVITQINRTPVGSADQAARALDYYADRGPITVFFERGGQLFRSDFQLR
ncbi:MAG TPA: trypsin-like peptidase domain-containing protein [Gemmatimonadaceae bacterium]